MPAHILVVGSSNTDMVVKTKTFPRPGETVLGGMFTMNRGGKGANQAVAAARLGGKVRFVAKVGDDLFGRQTREELAEQGLDVHHLAVSFDLPSGVALITVNADGENEIVVASGANMDLHPDDLPDAIFDHIEMVLIQLEIPLKTVEYIIRKCAELNIKLILNPAPAVKLSDDLLRLIYLITPNETETEILTGVLPENELTLENAARKLYDKGVKNIVITLGKRGVYLFNDNHNLIIPSPEVTAVDTTAAGDVFSGAMATALSENLDWIDACQFACKAAAVSVTRVGAQSAAPYRWELNT